MTPIVWLVLLLAAVLEVSGDLTIRRGMKQSQWWLVVGGMCVLGLYGFVVNRSQWDFSRLLGVYVAFFALVAVLTGRFYLHEYVPRSTWIGLAFIIGGGLVIQFGTPLFAQSPNRSIDSLMAQYAHRQGPGASVLVVRDGRVAYMKGYGLADVETGAPVTVSSNFRLASLSKQFTATAIMLLVADGRLRYDDAITTLLPGLPSLANGVTVRHLLNHTSGLPDYEDFVPDSQTAQVHDRDIPRLIALASALKFPAGARFAYSNTGYGLLALIVERTSAQRFADFLHDRIFAPLDMTTTVAHEDGRSVVARRAYGYSINATGVRRTDQSNTSAVLGDGGIYSSAADLAKWDRALEQHTLVAADAQQLAWTPPVLGVGQFTEYGFGWFADHDHGALRLRHHGESRGFTNSILRYPEKGLTVVILTNRTGGTPWDIAQRIAELYLDPSTGAPSAAWHP